MLSLFSAENVTGWQPRAVRGAGTQAAMGTFDALLETKAPIFPSNQRQGPSKGDDDSA
jgi:hypothetical protein